jgi:hypothetical protein
MDDMKKNLRDVLNYYGGQRNPPPRRPERPPRDEDASGWTIIALLIMGALICGPGLRARVANPRPECPQAAPKRAFWRVLAPGRPVRQTARKMALVVVFSIGGSLLLFLAMVYNV